MPYVIAVAHPFLIYGGVVAGAALLGVLVGVMIGGGPRSRSGDGTRNGGNGGGMVFGLIGLAASILSLLSNIGGARDFLLSLFGHK